MDLSIIIINWNGLGYLKDCLASVFQHTEGVEYEVIVVDNGSEDGSVEWIKDNYPEVNLVKNDSNRGFSEANNQGFEVASGKYIVLLNNDTYIKNNSFYQIYQFMENHPKAGIVGPKLLYPDGSEQVSAGLFPNLNRLFIDRILGFSKTLKFLGSREESSIIYGFSRQKLQRQTRPVDWVSGACLTVRRDLLEDLGGLDTNYTFGVEDVDLAYQGRKRGYKTYYLREAEVLHWKGGSRGESEESVESSVDPLHVMKTRVSSNYGMLYFFYKNKRSFEYTISNYIIKFGALLRLAYFKLRKLFTGDKSNKRLTGKIKAQRKTLELCRNTKKSIKNI